MGRVPRFLETPMDHWADFELDLSMADLMADLDPGWLVGFDTTGPAAAR